MARDDGRDDAPGRSAGRRPARVRAAAGVRRSDALAGVLALWLAAGAAGYVVLHVASWQVAAVVGLAVACGPGVASSVAAAV